MFGKVCSPMTCNTDTYAHLIRDPFRAIFGLGSVTPKYVGSISFPTHFGGSHLLRFFGVSLLNSHLDEVCTDGILMRWGTYIECRNETDHFSFLK